MAQKDATVAELTKNFEDSTAVLLTEYRGLTVAQLKELRAKLAAERHIPAYVIFSDATLRDMSIKKPHTWGDFLGGGCRSTSYS